MTHADASKPGDGAHHTPRQKCCRTTRETKPFVLASWHPVEGHCNNHTSSKPYPRRPSSSTTAGAPKPKKSRVSRSRKHPSPQREQTIGETEDIPIAKLLVFHTS